MRTVKCPNCKRQWSPSREQWLTDQGKGTELGSADLGISLSPRLSPNSFPTLCRPGLRPEPVPAPSSSLHAGAGRH
ncbi:hypothetical protein D623_10002602 [Myotis brandtii]|uniref:Uncharacterized protein n=1 Tax=Myotis brandtii TaxID=109478 RepID=S7MT98_MYOBR|nr:hypothetical protein D623_10002602 [Myotis brandtii]